MFAAVAELADAQDLGSCPERGGGFNSLSPQIKPRALLSHGGGMRIKFPRSSQLLHNISS